MRSLAIACCILTLACGDDDNAGSDEGANPDQTADLRPVTLAFAAVVGDDVFACGQTYANLGTGGSSWTARDLRFYVHDVELLAGDRAIPFTLEDDGRWQNGQVALLDFEDGCGEMGNPDLNDALRGFVPAGSPTEYSGVRFRIGVPEALNHANASTAGAPLNLTAMFWNWNGGYKFMRIEGPSDVFDAWRLHLGSTMCEGDMMGNASCATSNRPAIELSGSVPSQAITLDLAALWQDASFTNTMDTPPGCMSAPTDGDCAPIFSNLGLAFSGGPSQNQRVFTLR
ncbi:MAG: MbnP family copper-binding protein [Myxococcota bacterium]